MISTSLYPDSGTPYVSPSGNNIVSLTFNQLTGYPAIDTSSYYLGWISSDDLPVFSRQCDVEDMGDGVFRFFDTTDTDNFPVGYIVTSSYDDSAATFLENDEIPKNSGGTYSTLYNNFRFINQLYPIDSAFRFTSNILLGFHAFVQGESGVVRTTLSDIKHNGAVITTIAEVLKLLKYPDYEITATVGNYGTITFTSADWENGFPDILTTSTSASVRLFFISFSFIGDYYIKNASSGVTSVSIKPFVRATAGGNSYHKTLFCPTLSGSINVARYRSGTFYWMNYSTGGSFKKISSGLSGTVDASAVNSTTGYTFDGNVLAYYDNPNVYFCPILTLSDLRKSFAMQFRIDSRPATLSYVDGVTFATNVNSSEKFTTTYKTGDLEDTAYKNTLRLWQYEDFQENEFTEDEVPPYTPGPGPSPRPEPEPPGEDENSGDDILPPATLGVGATMGFVTQYCLNAAQISELGALLWTSFTDPDYWKNYMFSLALDTGSFNTSALLDYFVSLRVYPFPLLNVPSYTSWGQDMYVGTGVVPLHFTTALHYINTFADWVDAGSCSIPFTFGDFRDYNQEITLYLPFCGTVQLEPADVLGGTISAKYAVDFSSGSCTAVVMIETWDGHKYPIAILPGQIGADVPLTATTAGQVAARLGSDVLNVAGILLDGAKGAAGAVAPMVAGAVTENPAMVATGAAQMAGNNVSTVAGLAGQALNMATRPGIGAPMLSGGRGFSSFGCPQKCYVQIRRPFYDAPTNYESTEGHPAAEQVLVSLCQGLARFVNPNVASIEAMEEEKEEIRRRLATGVIV